MASTASTASTPSPGAAQVLVASNRGPVSYEVDDDGSLHARRGGGGLVSGLSAIGPDAGALWVCSALSDGDREAVRRGVGEDGVRMLAIPADVHADAYNGIANSVLWFVHHMLYQTPLEPVFDAEFRRQWASYETYNRAFAEALAQEAAEGARCAGAGLPPGAWSPGCSASSAPTLRIGHFSHTPWAPPEYFAMLPEDIQVRLMEGLLGADRVAFLTWRVGDGVRAVCAGSRPLSVAARVAVGCSPCGRAPGEGSGHRPRADHPQDAHRCPRPRRRRRSSCTRARTRRTSRNG
ncbi:trehalose-6-phosphate synthase [Streptomyces sp. L7]